MNLCPFCPGKIYPTFANGLAREKCGRCQALWFEGDALANLVGTQAADLLVQKTQGMPGQCKKCSSSLPHVNKCLRCGQAAPTCPQCGTAPLAAAVIEGVRVDVCCGCKGLAMDAEGMKKLVEIVAQRRPARPSDKPKQAPKTLTKIPCTSCERKYLLKYTFTYDGKIFCGSCAPSGAAPFSEDIAQASHTLAPILDSFLTGNEDLSEEFVAAGITLLFKLAASQLMR